jgi:hypothetical protein
MIPARCQQAPSLVLQSSINHASAGRV